MMRRAIREDWPVSEELRKLAIEKCQHVLQSSNEPRAVIAAVRALQSAWDLNLKATQMERDSDKPVVIVNNNVGQDDAQQQKFLESLSPELQQQYLNYRSGDVVNGAVLSSDA